MIYDMGEEGYRRSQEEFQAFMARYWTPEQLADMRAQTAANLERMKLERDDPAATARAELAEIGMLK